MGVEETAGGRLSPRLSQMDQTEVRTWVSLDDGREVLVRTPLTPGEATQAPFTFPVGGHVVLSRHHRWWSRPTAWEFYEGEGFLRRVW